MRRGVLRKLGFGKLPFTMTVLAMCIALPQSGAHASDVMSGIPQVVDGDTVQIGQTKIRLQGIDAPETDQLCLDPNGQTWACGIAARDELIKHSAGSEWDCDLASTDRYGRSLGSCFVEGEDVSAWMVRQGWALSFVKYSHSYDADEMAARQAPVGLWRGAFIAPWDWRHRNKETVVLGAAAVSIHAQASLLGAVSAAGAPDASCVIKGNVNRKGERIFHLPGQLNYSKTSMNKGLGERWFCSEAEAEAAGWRKAAH